MDDLRGMYADELRGKLSKQLLEYAQHLRVEIEWQGKFADLGQAGHELKSMYNASVRASIQLYEAMYAMARELHRVSGISTATLMISALLMASKNIK